jgi:hypothetical protein
MIINHQIQFTRISRNAKTGPIAVTTTSEESCPQACPLKRNGCYAESGPLAILWRKVTDRKAGLAWDGAMAEIAKLPKGSLWRHNQAGDLPGVGDDIAVDATRQLVRANRGKRGYTYTHKPVTGDSATSINNALLIAEANEAGFAVNLSANSLAHADELAATGLGPVVVVLPADQTRATVTPHGRKVAICPATISDTVTCATCGLCAVTGRKAIIGFPAHGASKRKAGAVARAA